jgi:hypothetical protein
MSDVQVVDPLGHTVRFESVIWYGHVLDAHPDMKPFRGLVRRALTDPIEIRRSNSKPDHSLYYMRMPKRNLFMQVIVRQSDWTVRSVHLAKKITGGERLWP